MTETQADSGNGTCRKADAEHMAINLCCRLLRKPGLRMRKVARQDDRRRDDKEVKVSFHPVRIQRKISAIEGVFPVERIAMRKTRPATTMVP